MISAEKLLKVLAKKDLLPAEVVRKLQQQMAAADKPVPAASLAKRLVEKGYLTPVLAKRILRGLEEKAESQGAPAAKPTLSPAEDDDLLGLAPDYDAEKKKAEEASKEGWERELDLEEAAAPPKKPSKPAAPAKPVMPARPKPEASRPIVPAPLQDDVLVGETLSGEIVSGEIISGEIVGGEIVGGEIVSGKAVGSRRGRAALADDDDDSDGKGKGKGKGKKKKQPKGFLAKLFGERERDRSRKENVWDSSLMLVGGGGLLLLVISGAALAYALWGRGADDQFKTAEKFYSEQSYSKAIAEYKKFADQYPKHEKASVARVKMEIARLRQVVESGRDPVAGLTTAKDVMEKITSEKAFPDVRDELASLLPEVAEELTKDAKQKTDAKLVTQAREALAMVENDKYIPVKNRPKAQIDEIKATLGWTERMIARDSQLAAAVAAMRKAVADKKTHEAYQIRKKLLREYPDLLDNAQLGEAIRAVSAAEQAAVSWVEKPTPPEPADAAAADGVTVALAQHVLQRGLAGAEGRVFHALIDGSVFGLDAASGRVLWRRPSGQQTEGTRLPIAPMPLDNGPGADVLLVDGDGQSLVRVASATGKTVWRQPLGETIDAEPILDGGRALVATASGRLVTIDTGSGESPGFVRLPQALDVPPTLDSKRSKIYQLAKHSNLFVLSADGKKCDKVVYLAQEPGSIVTSPVILGNYLIVAENQGFNRSVLRVLSLDAQDKLPAYSPLQQIELVGRVDLQPLVSGAQILVTTDRGRVFAYRLSGNKTGRPLEKMTDERVSQRQDLIRFPLLVQGQFWIADERLAKYELQSAMGKIGNVWTIFEESTFLQRPMALDDALIVVRRRNRLPGVVVSAVGMRQPDIFWETTLAAPLAGEPIVDTASGKVLAVTSLGGVAELPIDQIQGQRVVDKMVAMVPSDQLGTAIRCVVTLGGGQLAFSAGAGSEQVYVHDPRDGSRGLRNVVLPDPLGTAPVALAGAILAPCGLGQVYLVDPASGGRVAQPFQPKLDRENRPNWRPPAVVDSQSFVISDGGRGVYYLGLKSQPERHLALLNQVQATEPIVSPLASIGELVLAVDRAGGLQRLRLPALSPEKSEALGGQPVFGPRKVGERVFVTTDADELFCLDKEGKVAWKTALPYGPLAGPPVALGNDFLFASCSGTVWRVEGASGKELGKHDLGRPLGTGPVLLGKQVLVAGQDGVLYRLDTP